MLTPERLKEIKEWTENRRRLGQIGELTFRHIFELLAHIEELERLLAKPRPPAVRDSLAEHGLPRGDSNDEIHRARR